MKKGNFVRFLLALCFVLFGCSRTTPGPNAEPKTDPMVEAREALMEAIEFSDKQSGFKENWEYQITENDQTLLHQNSSTYVCFEKGNEYVFSFSASLINSERRATLTKITPRETIQFSGTTSSSNYRDVYVDEVASYEYTQNIEQDYFYQLLEMFIDDHVKDFVSYTLTKNGEGYLISLKPVDVNQYNEGAKSFYKQLGVEENFIPYFDFSVDVQITNGEIQNVDMNQIQNSSGQERRIHSVIRYSPIDTEIDLQAADSLMSEVKVGNVQEGSYVIIETVI